MTFVKTFFTYIFFSSYFKPKRSFLYTCIKKMFNRIIPCFLFIMPKFRFFFLCCPKKRCSFVIISIEENCHKGGLPHETAPHIQKSAQSDPDAAQAAPIRPCLSACLPLRSFIWCSAQRFSTMTPMKPLPKIAKRQSPICCRTPSSSFPKVQAAVPFPHRMYKAPTKAAVSPSRG